MVKDLKYILKRVLIGVLIALALMYFKGGLIADVHAEGGIYSWQTNNNSNFASCSACHGIDYTLTMFNYQALKNKDGYLYLSFAFYSTTYNGEFLPVSPVARVFAGNNTYNCTIYGTSDHNRVLNNNTEMTTASYSAVCPVHLPSDGSGISKVSIYVLGASSSGVGISFYSPSTFVVSEGSEITNAINENTQATNDLNDSVTSDESPDDSDIEGVFDFDDDSSNSPVSDLITLPITLLQAFNDGFSSSCSAFNLGTLYGHSISLPCIDMQDLLGSNLWGLIDMCFSLFLVYNIGLMCVSIYESITSLEDGFRSLYTPKHAEKEYEPKHGGGS